MKRNTKPGAPSDAQPDAPVSTEPFIDAPPADVPTMFSPKSGRADRRGSVSVKFNDDGVPDFQALKGKQLEKWEELCSNPEFQQRFGLQPKKFEVDPQMVSGLLDALGRVQATIFSIKFKLPYDVAVKIACYNEQEKELLVPPSKRVIEKHAPALAAKYGDEIVLATLITNITMVKISACRQVAEQLKKAEESGASKVNGEAKTVIEQPITGQVV